MHMRVHAHTARSVAGTIGLLLLSFGAPGFAQEITVSQVDPDSASALSVPAQQLTPAQMEALMLRKLQIREGMAAIADATAPVAPPGLPAVVGRETREVEYATQYPGPPATFIIGRNNKNTRANTAGLGSTLAEPTAANDGIQVLSAGNFNHAEFSVDGGVTYTNIALPGGPSDAPSL